MGGSSFDDGAFSLSGHGLFSPADGNLWIGLGLGLAVAAVCTFGVLRSRRSA